MQRVLALGIGLKLILPAVMFPLTEKEKRMTLIFFCESVLRRRPQYESVRGLDGGKWFGESLWDTLEHLS